MGLLFTTEGTRRIINTLNTAFDGPGKGFGLDFIQQQIKGTRIYNKVNNRSWPAGRLARMLKLLPYDQGSGEGSAYASTSDPLNPTNPPVTAGKRDDAKHVPRWHYFLTKVVGANSTVLAQLQGALADAILGVDANNKQISPPIVRVTFDHVEIDEYPPDPTNPAAPCSIVIFDAPLYNDNAASLATSGNVRHITLFTPRVASGIKGENFEKIGNDESELSSAPWATDTTPIPAP